MLKALIFDVDGTLADTEAVHLEAFNHAFVQEGMGWHWDMALYTQLLEVSGGKERMAHYWGMVNADVKELSAGATQATIHRLHEIKTAYYENAVNNGAVQLRPGVLALMNEALKQGLSLAIATTTSPVNIAALLRAAVGADWRSHFLAVGDASSSPLKKPHPQVYLQVLNDMGLQGSQCLAFEDSFNGLRAAMAAGIRTIITPNSFTAHHDFAGALRVVPDLSQVGLAHLRDWHAQASTRMA
ncbi:MAG: HAD-IA family hydrolase [Hydrogenophaga sp.]|nr:HAD-IA family hydrolase [Hydrogenophaga sp.]